jgi:hypothetical protein
MKTEYQLSLEKWARNLSDEQLNNYMQSLERFSDQELDALFFEDLRRMSDKTKAKLS